MNYEDIKKGQAIRVDGELYSVLWCQHHKPGKGGAVMRTKLRNMTRGTTLERVFRGGDSIEEVYVEHRQAQVLYQEDMDYVLMDKENFEQYTVPADLIGDGVKFLKEGVLCEVSLYQGQAIVVSPPQFVVLEVADTDPGLKGDTASGGSKPATLETGAVIQVPLFLDIGERVKVDTREERYIERA